MFETVLVADRGVTGLRVVRACQRLGVQAVAVHGDDDARARHVREADDAVPLGGRTVAETYGDRRKLLEAARRTGAQAVHPGAGVVALDAAFAQQVQEVGLVWLGPSPGPDQAFATVDAPSRRVTVVLHARSGGVVDVVGRRARLGGLLEEEPSPAPVGGDITGRLAALAERGGLSAGGALCAIDAPAAHVCAGDDARAAGGAHADDGDAVRVVPLVAPGSPATDAVSGLDLVAAQLRLAAGDPLPPHGARAGHAMALHVRAAGSFAGRLRRFRLPGGEGVQAECAVAERDRLTAGSDRLLAVVTVRGRDRAEVLERARAAVEEMEVAGVPTTLPALRAVVRDPAFVAGRLDDTLLERIRWS